MTHTLLRLSFLYLATAVLTAETSNVAPAPSTGASSFTAATEHRRKMTATNQPADAEAEQELAKMERDWAKAVVDGDAAVIDRIQADDFAGWDFEGKAYTKADNIQGIESGKWKTISLDLDDLKVRVFGETAVVTCRVTRKGRFDDRDTTGQFRWTQLYTKRQGHWQMVAAQGTRIEQQTQERAANDAEQEVLQMEKDRLQAVLKSDTAALDHILADDYIQITNYGEVRNKGQQVGFYKAGEIKQLFNFSNDVIVRTYAGTAVVTGRTKWQELFKGEKRNGEFRFTRVWVKRQRGWQLGVFQGTRIAKP